MNTYTSHEQTDHLIATIRDESTKFQYLADEVKKVIVGNHDTITMSLVAILCNGHILLEGVPGIAKTTLIKSLTTALGLSFKRIQFTPDLLPSDLIGTLIYNQKTQDFEVKKGPLFANLILADEINRAPAKVQSALLEAMQEHQVTIGNQTYQLDEPFLVFATQNPSEQEGTYQLPEAQIDRFLFKLPMTYPAAHEEKEILHKYAAPKTVHKILTREDILTAQQHVNSIYVDERIVDYIVSLVTATRSLGSAPHNDFSEYISCGASPRATLALYQTARAYAFLQKRHFVIPQDVKTVAYAVLRHRIVTTYQAEAEKITPDMLIGKLLSALPTP